MTLGDAVDEVLDAHIAAGNGLFRGIRHATAFDTDPAVRRSHTRPTPGLMADPAFRTGVHRLAAKAMTFDAWLYHPQIVGARRPRQRRTRVHVRARPPRRPARHRRRTRATAKRSRRVADRHGRGWRLCENVVVKLGGIGMAIYGMGYEHRADPPSSDELVARRGAGPITFTIEQFGADRCMFESNFPGRQGVGQLRHAVERLQEDRCRREPGEQSALFHDTAERVYSI